MKYILNFSFLILILVSCNRSKNHEKSGNEINATFTADKMTSQTDTTKWKLVFDAEFNSKGSFDTNKWSFCSRGNAAWSKYLTKSSDYAYLDGNNLVLRMDNQNIPGDDIPYHSAGISTKNKFSFTYGKVEIRAKFKQGQGSWPAIWMKPDRSTYGGWPKSGEIDIMEHINYENVIQQTVHDETFYDLLSGDGASVTSPYNVNSYNVYGLIWTPNALKFFVNGTLHFTYAKPKNATPSNWPFNEHFYLILNQSGGGGGWPGPITNSDLPFRMKVDWVRVYQKK